MQIADDGRSLAYAQPGTRKGCKVDRYQGGRVLGSTTNVMYGHQPLSSGIFIGVEKSYMQRTLVRKLGITCVVIAFVGISVLSIALIARAKQDLPFVLKNQTVPLVSRAQLMGPASSQQQL